MTDLDDHAVAVEVARSAGELLVGILESETHDPYSWGLEVMADQSAHEHIVDRLAEHRPDDIVLSEEGRDNRARLKRDRVWIVDPLDGSADFGYSGQWSVHVALVVRGRPVAGAVAVPALGATYGTRPPAEPVVSRTTTKPLVVVPRSRRFDARWLIDGVGAEVATLGSAGVKAMTVVRGEADAYVHGGGLYEWDTCAPIAVAEAAGFRCVHLDGSEVEFNKPRPWTPGVVIGRLEVVDRILDAVAELRD